jgi:tight adherence protein C
MMNFLSGIGNWQHAIMMLAIIAFALAFLTVGVGLLLRGRVQNKQVARLDAVTAARAGLVPETSRGGLKASLLQLGVKGGASSLGRAFVVDEDRVLLDQCGVDDPNGRAWFFLARAVLGVGLPALGWLFLSNGSLARILMIGVLGFGIGYMAPKWIMQRKAAARRKQAENELPLLIDLLRLLQGVGLSIDQTLQLIEQDFKVTMPVLCSELAHASAQYRSGRTRAASLQRFSSIFANEDMTSIADLLVQVDRFGGAVQEPLKLFGERMRERRRMELKARIGRLMVKMTGVMVMTLLPALLVVTGGAGFLAIVRGLSKFGGGA